MHYWQLHIGDWSKSCGHLTPSETGLYVRLLNIYYDTEKPIPADVSAACRLVGARTTRERDEISCLLSEFFSLEADGWHNKRADNEINKMHQKSEKARNSISHRWNNERNTNVSGTNNEGNTLQESKTPRLQDPIQDQEQSATPPAADATERTVIQKEHIPYQTIVDSYNATCGELYGHVTKITDKRKRAIKARWLEDPSNEDQDRRTNALEYWQRYYRKATRVEFFLKAARGENKGEHAGWRPSFDFLMRQDTWLGVREGRFQ